MYPYIEKYREEGGQPLDQPPRNRTGAIWQKKRGKEEGKRRGEKKRGREEAIGCPAPGQVVIPNLSPTPVRLNSPQGLTPDGKRVRRLSPASARHFRMAPTPSASSGAGRF